MTTTGRRICDPSDFEKTIFNTICAREFLVLDGTIFLVIRKLDAISAKVISLLLRIVNFNRNCGKRREYLKFLTEISNFGKTHFILERVICVLYIYDPST